MKNYAREQNAKVRPWRKLLWAVETYSPLSRPHLIGRLWHDSTPKPYDGEPTRALLFCTRKDARAYCRAEHDKYRGRQDCCADWRFRPVRVLETVRKV